MKTVTVATAEDDLNEPDETFKVALSGVTLPAGVSLGDARGGGDDHRRRRVDSERGWSCERTWKRDRRRRSRVTVTGTSTTAVVVSYEVDTTVSTATATDYTAPSETELTISAGVASGTIEVVTATDAVLEPDETLVLELHRSEHGRGGERGNGDGAGDDRGSGHGDGVGGGCAGQRRRLGAVRGGAVWGGVE